LLFAQTKYPGHACSVLTPKSDRSDDLRAAVHARLTRVRGALTDEQFDRLIAAVLQTQIRFQEIEQGESREPKPFEPSTSPSSG
jgi:hypothetical protein